MAEVRAVLLGPGGTGKSNTCIRWVSGHYCEFYDPGIEDIYRKQYTYKDRTCLLELFDTGGREEMKLARKLSFSPAKYACAVFVYDITSLNSFRECINLLREMREIAEYKSVPTLFLGNKIDLEAKREVKFDEAKPILVDAGVTEVMECSCKDNTNMEAAFKKTCDLLASSLPAVPAKKSKGCSLL